MLPSQSSRISTPQEKASKRREGLLAFFARDETIPRGKLKAVWFCCVKINYSKRIPLIGALSKVACGTKRGSDQGCFISGMLRVCRMLPRDFLMAVRHVNMPVFSSFLLSKTINSSTQTEGHRSAPETNCCVVGDNVVRRVLEDSVPFVSPLSFDHAGSVLR